MTTIMILFELKLYKLSFFAGRSWSRCASGGCQEEQGGQKRRLIFIFVFFVDFMFVFCFVFWLIFVFVFAVFHIRQFHPQVEGWVVSRRVKRGEEATCPVCLEDLEEGEQVENGSS